jgi:acyl CoA:acetate/3-ketoacid CoA transferase beta subunit
VSVVCCQVEIPATGRSLVQRITTDCGVSECDDEASTMRNYLPTMDCRAIGKNGRGFLISLGAVSVARRIVLH